MPLPPPAEAARRWAQRLGAATDKIRSGVQAVTVSPGEKAVRQVDQYVAGIQRAVAERRWQDGLLAMTLQDWKDMMLTKGLPRIASGAQAAIPKFERFLTAFFPHLETGLRQLESMPRGDLQQNIARAVFMIEHNARFHRSGR